MLSDRRPICDRWRGRDAGRNRAADFGPGASPPSRVLVVLLCATAQLFLIGCERSPRSM